MTTESTKEEIRHAVTSWLKGFNSRDTDEFFKLFHPDAIYANDGSPLMRGSEQIQPWYRQAFKMVTGRALFKEEAIIADGNMAFVVGKIYMEPEDVAESSTGEVAAPVPGETGRVAIVYRRTEEGKWLLAFDMDNRPPDVKPEEFQGVGSDHYLLPAQVQR